MAEWDYELFWNETLNQIKETIGDVEFGRWFKLVEYLEAEEQKIVLGVPSNFYRDQLKKRYQSSIEGALKLVAGQDVTLAFKVAPPRAGTEPPKGAGSPPGPGAGDSPGAPSPGKLPGTQPNLFPPDMTPSAPPKSKKGRHPLLREDYTFERYVIGENNNFAANAALAISRNPGTVYNPFLIYGGVGLGKTHLMQAVGNYVHHHTNLKVIYITTESFINEFIKAIREKQTSAFKNKYRFADLLLVDDIQFFEKKWETQDELFHTFNALYDANKHIIFTCDRPASELKEINDRLRSRFERGLNVDLHPPNYETRFAILKTKLQDRPVNISDAVLDFVAQNVTTNVRELEAALTKLTAYAGLLGKPVSLDIARQQLRYVFASSPEKQPSISVEKILLETADYFHLPPNDLKSSKRTQKIALPRQIAMYIAREITDFSATEIGQHFEGRHYSTVMHACEKIENQCRSDPPLESSIQAIIDRIKESAQK
jgi:chromosomal replication initiator protein